MNCRRNHGSTGASLEICSEILKGMVQPLRPYLPPKTHLADVSMRASSLGADKQKAASRRPFSSEKKGNDEGYSGH